MASLTDIELMSKLQSLKVDELKAQLRSRKVPFSAYKKQELCELAFYAIRLGLEVLPTEKEEDRQRVKCQLEKLKLGPFMNLPHPSTLDNWDVDTKHIPPITEESVNEYFAACKLNLIL